MLKKELKKLIKINNFLNLNLKNYNKNIKKGYNNKEYINDIIYYLEEEVKKLKYINLD
jgi:hypothetical protein